MTIAFLKRILTLDAATCALFSLAMLGFAGALSGVLGLAPAYLLAGGAICLGACLLLAFAATRNVPPAILVGLIAFLNLDWAIASVIVFEIEMTTLTALGKVAILGQAAGVLVFAGIEAMGWRMLSRRGSSATA